MASVKLAQLIIRTLAKPISTSLKNQAKSHPGFRTATISFAQWLHKAEVNARTGLLRETQPKVRMLNDETGAVGHDYSSVPGDLIRSAIEKGANFLSEAFLFAVAAGLILSETLRSSRATARRRDRIDDELALLREEVDRLRDESQKRSEEDRMQLLSVSDTDKDIAKVVDRLVDVLRRGQWIDRTLEKDPAWQADTQALHARVQKNISANLEPA